MRLLFNGSPDRILIVHATFSYIIVLRADGRAGVHVLDSLERNIESLLLFCRVLRRFLFHFSFAHVSATHARTFFVYSNVYKRASCSLAHMCLFFCSYRINSHICAIRRASKSRQEAKNAPESKITISIKSGFFQKRVAIAKETEIQRRIAAG